MQQPLLYNYTNNLIVTDRLNPQIWYNVIKNNIRGSIYIMDMYLMQFGSILLFYISVLNLNSFKFNIKEKLLMVFLTQIASSILLNISEFMTIIPMLIIAAIFIYRGGRNIVRSISIPIISAILFILSDYLVSNICVSVLGITQTHVRENIILYYLLISIDALFLFFVTKSLGVLINRKSNLSSLEIKGKFGMLIVASLLLTIIIFYINIIYQSNQGSSSNIIRVNGILFFSYFILLMIIIYILITSITKEMDLKNKQIQFDSLQEYTSSLEKLYADMRSFRHDYINILSSMIGYIENRDIDSLEKYFNEKIFPLSKGMASNNFKLGLLSNIKIPEIKGIFSSKIIRAQELNIDVFIDIAEPIERIDMDIIDISRVIGILLDNAIEAAIKCEKPSMKVAVINKENSVLFVIINSIYEEVLIYKIYEKGYSTKGENRGLGLYNLKQITGKYTNVSIDTIVENGEFKQLLEIAKR